MLLEKAQTYLFSSYPWVKKQSTLGSLALSVEEKEHSGFQIVKQEIMPLSFPRRKGNSQIINKKEYVKLTIETKQKMLKGLLSLTELNYMIYQWPF